MIERYRRLAERMRSALTDLEREVQRVQRSWDAGLRADAPDQDAYVDSVALRLHAFYSGLERLFELIASQVDGTMPSGADWHREILDRMAKPILEVRPEVVGSQTTALLDELRKFRHLVRNVYTFSLSPDRMQKLVSGLPSLWASLKADLTDFAGFLEQLSRADEMRGGSGD
ncbi:MAG: antitoxin [Planctomycetes bacterium]|nr:antitoxin [Planctomycetota bacterium]MBM4080685.1 antitoxin [Planctomycetota bacterium]MBM4085992.1 antitoxin [Planctomycetota bacterium]